MLFCFGLSKWNASNMDFDLFFSFFPIPIVLPPLKRGRKPARKREYVRCFDTIQSRAKWQFEMHTKCDSGRAEMAETDETKQTQKRCCLSVSAVRVKERLIDYEQDFSGQCRGGR